MVGRLPQGLMPVVSEGSDWSGSSLSEEVAGKNFGDYRVISSIRRGGMGEVFLAEYGPRGEPGRKVVLKRLLADYVDDAHYVSMFRSEAQVMSRLNHPNIVNVFDVPLIDGKQCLAMEYVQGRNLQQIMKRCHKLDSQLPPQVALHMVLEALRGLEYAHTYVLDDGRPLELVHRDVTPGNILVSFDGDVKITDFGIAKSKMSSLSTTVGVVKGTTRYLSPEQVRGQEVTVRSDIFTAAVVLTELLSGAPLFDRGSVPSTLLAIATSDRPPIASLIPFHAPVVSKVLEQATSVLPSERFESAREFSDALMNASPEIGRSMNRDGLSAFMKQLFRDTEELSAFAADSGHAIGLGGMDLTYLLEAHDPRVWGAVPSNATADVDLDRARDALRSMVPAARPLEADAFRGTYTGESTFAPMDVETGRVNQPAEGRIPPLPAPVPVDTTARGVVVEEGAIRTADVYIPSTESSHETNSIVSNDIENVRSELAPPPPRRSEWGEAVRAVAGAGVFILGIAFGGAMVTMQAQKATRSSRAEAVKAAAEAHASEHGVSVLSPISIQTEEGQDRAPAANGDGSAPDAVPGGQGSSMVPGGQDSPVPGKAGSLVTPSGQGSSVHPEELGSTVMSEGQDSAAKPDGTHRDTTGGASPAGKQAARAAAEPRSGSPSNGGASASMADAAQASQNAGPTATTAKKPATIDIRFPRGARVRIDGIRLRKKVPIYKFVVEAGRRRIRISKKGYTREFEFDIRSGERLEVSEEPVRIISR